MDVAALVALVTKYGPTLIGLIVKYGPAVWAAVAPLVKASIEAGTLERDIEALFAKAKTAAAIFGGLSSLEDVAAALGSIEMAPAAVEDPIMERAAGPKHGGNGR